MENDDLNNLVYNKSDTEANVPVDKVDKNLLRAFIHYVSYARANGNPLLDSNAWGAITQEDFDGYRIIHFVPLTVCHGINVT